MKGKKKRVEWIMASLSLCIAMRAPTPSASLILTTPKPSSLSLNLTRTCSSARSPLLHCSFLSSPSHLSSPSSVSGISRLYFPSRYLFFFHFHSVPSLIIIWVVLNFDFLGEFPLYLVSHGFVYFFFLGSVDRG